MRVSVSTAKPDEVACEALVVPLAEGEPLAPEVELLDRALGGLLGRLLSAGNLKPRTDTQEVFHTLGKLPCQRLVVVGLGKPAEVDLKRFTDWCIRAAKRVRRCGVTEAVVLLPRLAAAEPQRLAAAAVEGFELGASDFLKYKADGDRLPEIVSLNLLGTPADAAALQAGVARGQAVARGMSFARELGNEPANVATPTYLAERAREMAGRCGLRCEVLGAQEMEAAGMGALLGVARGSEEPPRFIVLELDGAADAATVALVGKGLTFDSGGISIKPAQRMHEMKFDMCGGAAVLGAMQALSQLGPRHKVVGLVPSTENLPSGRALKPGDVLRSMSGITIEVTNTDAEGRLILADALTYARRYQPTAVIDIATLTGAIVVTLGAHAFGIMGNDPAFVDHVKDAGFRTGERVWPLPLWKEYLEHMKSDTADLCNSSNAGGKSITAAAFLSRFAEGMRWAHLDIAGTAWTEPEGERLIQGATGSGVRTLVEAVLTLP